MIQDMRKGIQAVKCDFSDKHFKTNSFIEADHRQRLVEDEEAIKHGCL